MAYRDCPCFKCGEKQREERVACRKKCTEFTAWKLATQAAKNKRDEENKKFHSETKKEVCKKKDDESEIRKKGMRNPCRACAELNCMGICADKVKQKEKYYEMTDRVRQQIIDHNNRRGERGQERTDPIHRHD